MAQLSETFDRYDLAAQGDDVREQLSNVITNISPTDYPFMSMCGSGKTGTSDFTEWLEDKYRDPDLSNAYLDGDAFQPTARSDARRLGNYHQISKEGLRISRRANKLTKAGRTKELAYQLMKAGNEVNRDVESIATANQAAVAGTSSVAPLTASLNAWYRTNTSRGGTGTDPTLSSTTYGFPNAAAGDGTVRALTETLVLDGVQNCYKQGGKPSCIMTGVEVKRRFSNYLFTDSARVASQYQDFGKSPAGGVTSVGSVDFYVTDYGRFEIVPNRFSRERDVHILDKSSWDMSYIDKMKIVEMAKGSDTEDRELIMDWALICRAENANAVVADIDETAPMVA